MSFVTFNEVYKVLHRSTPELNYKKKSWGKTHSMQHMASMLSTR